MVRLSLWASHSLTAGRSVVFLCSTISSPVPPPLLCLRYVPPIFPQGAQGLRKPPSGETSKITNHCSPSLFHSSFFPPLEQTPTLSSIPLFPPGLQNSCSPPHLIIPHPKRRSFLPPLIHPKPTSFKFLKVPVGTIFFTPCTPPHPSPFHRYHIVFVPHSFVLSSPAPLVSCLVIWFCVSALTRAST